MKNINISEVLASFVDTIPSQRRQRDMQNVRLCLQVHNLRVCYRKRVAADISAQILACGVNANLAQLRIADHEIPHV